MNWNQGLRRVSAVFWGFWALLSGVFGASLLVLNGSREWDAGLIFIACLLPLYIAYRVTCWIVDGFFQPRLS